MAPTLSTLPPWQATASAAVVTHSTMHCTEFYGTSGSPMRSVSTSMLSRLARRHALPSTTTTKITTTSSPRPRAQTVVIMPTQYSKEPISLIGRQEDTVPCLDTRLAEQLRAYLPRRISIGSRWQLWYSLDQHGCSIRTLFRLARAHRGPCLLIIRTMHDELLGAYISEPLHECDMVYYGSGESFLWKQSTASHVQVYRWTGVNDYMIVSNRDFIAFGGGDGHTGLWLHGDLARGHTQPCATYGNATLTDHGKFECASIELWGFDA